MNSGVTARPEHASEDSRGHALASLEALLEAQRTALVGGDLEAIRSTQARIHALLVNPGWQREVARMQSPDRLRQAMHAVAINARLASRGENAALRGLNALNGSPALYGAGGSMMQGFGGIHRSGRGLCA